MITNFKPTNFNSFYNNNLNDILNNKNNLNNNQIFCKNFLIFIMLLKYKNSFFIKNKFFVKKYKKKVTTILRSPYRHKLARHQISLNRYSLNFSFCITLKKPIKFENNHNLVIFINYLKKIKKLFESNIIYINNSNFNFPIKNSNNFKLKNYNYKQ